MTSPVVEARATSTTTTNQSSHTIGLPAGIVEGNLLLWFFAADGAPGGTFPGGWDLLDFTSNGAACRMWTYYRAADGTEGASVSVTTGNVQHSASVVLRISGAEAPATQAPEKAGATGGATGTSAAPNPPSVTPTGGAKDYLFVAVNAADGGRASTVAPTNFINLQAADSGAATDGVALGTAERSVNAASEDPGTFTIDASDEWLAHTIVIHPHGPWSEPLFYMQSTGGAFTATADLIGPGELVRVSIANTTSVAHNLTLFRTGGIEWQSDEIAPSGTLEYLPDASVTHLSDIESGFARMV